MYMVGLLSAYSADRHRRMSFVCIFSVAFGPHCLMRLLPPYWLAILITGEQRVS